MLASEVTVATTFLKERLNVFLKAYFVLKSWKLFKLLLAKII